ncbi:macrolide family glycosyltransferase [Tengunoibacter tsumagoiensis]|uniref:Glycosyl transferase n=1 Tax=Tengunoibacter tsumagoiensis TaxID=2014871 RepID=A0A402A6B9_9CHLR|nr:macrolide family glycosyltransferase [Tengunoibacter tsumagoiensis]GCE14680.1 glycosyl transferase [Tengunoibacter tsumagoiensis]
MPKYVFLNVPAHGHVNPTLAVAQELVNRGQEVSYYLTEDFRAPIEATGAVFQPYTSSMPAMRPPTNWNLNDPAVMQNMMPLRMIEESKVMIPQLLDRIRAEQPDYILYDMMCLWGKLLAQILHVPAIALRPSYAMNAQFNLVSIMRSQQSQAGGPPPEIFKKLDATLAQICETYHIPTLNVMDMFAQPEPLNIVFIPRSFQPFAESFDERFVFVGPALQPRLHDNNFPLERLHGKTTLYISLGTVFNSQTQFFNQCFAAFKDSPYQVVMAYGKNIDPSELDAIPENFLVAPHIPQLDVLAHSSVFISHCGMNSTMESLYYGVPLIGIPQMPEQAMNAKRVQELGLGIALNAASVTAEVLRASVEKILADPTYRQQTLAMQETVRTAGGAQKAVDALMHLKELQKA